MNENQANQQYSATIAAAIRLSYIRNVVNDFDLTCMPLYQKIFPAQNWLIKYMNQGAASILVTGASPSVARPSFAPPYPLLNLSSNAYRPTSSAALSAPEIHRLVALDPQNKDLIKLGNSSRATTWKRQ